MILKGHTATYEFQNKRLQFEISTNWLIVMMASMKVLAAASACFTISSHPSPDNRMHAGILVEDGVQNFLFNGILFMQIRT